MTDVILINNVKAKSISYRPVSKKAVDHVKKTIKQFDGDRVKVAYGHRRYALWTELTNSKLGSSIVDCSHHRNCEKKCQKDKDEIISQIEELCTEYSLQEDNEATGEHMLETIMIKAFYNYTSKANLLQLKIYVESALDRINSQ